jgi:adenylate cyclase
MRWRKSPRRSGWPFLAGLLVTALALALNFIGVHAVERAGMLLFDSFQKAAPRERQDAPVRIVDIDEESIRRLGQWPWPRSDLARLNDVIADAGASAIVYDIVFSEPDRTSPHLVARQMRDAGGSRVLAEAIDALPDHDAQLAHSFARAPVVAGYFLLNDHDGAISEPKAGVAIAGTLPDKAVPYFRRATEPLPALMAAARGAGFVSLAADSDGVVRQIPLVANSKRGLVPSLTLEALRVAQGAESIQVRTSDASGETGRVAGQMTAIKVGEFEAPTTASGSLWMHFTGPKDPVASIPAWRLISGDISGDALRNELQGRIILVGTGAAGLRDLVSTPVQERELGVAVHAQAIEQIILGQFLQRPDWATGAERALIILLGVGLAFFLPRLGSVPGAAIAFVAAGATMAASWLLFTRQGYLFDPTWPILATAAVYVVQTAIIFYREERRRAYIHSAFDRYLSPEMVRRIAEDPDRLELGGEERDMTVLFCDIRGFTRISEGLGPRQIIALLIAFLTPMCDLLLARKATVDKFMGDAILAFWNAPLDDPEHHVNAARAALSMIDGLQALNARAPAIEGAPWPGELKIGIGLNSGACCVGNMGSSQRLSYSLLGDAVNLASRIEGLTKEYGVTIALGEDLAEHLPGFALIELDLVRVVGRNRPVRVFALLGDELLAQSSAFRDFAVEHGAMLAAYRAQQWATAGSSVSALEAQAMHFGLHRLHMIYRQRIEILSSNPPAADWDGVAQAASK